MEIFQNHVSDVLRVCFICNGTTKNDIYQTQFIPVPILSPLFLRISFQLLLFFVWRKQFPKIY